MEDTDQILVPFSIINNSDGSIEGPPVGWYYTVGDPPEEGEDMMLAGPFSTQEEAFEAAKAFILDAMTNMADQLGGDIEYVGTIDEEDAA